MHCRASPAPELIKVDNLITVPASFCFLFFNAVISVVRSNVTVYGLWSDLNSTRSTYSSSLFTPVKATTLLLYRIVVLA